jgi:hypothetical protein
MAKSNVVTPSIMVVKTAVEELEENIPVPQEQVKTSEVPPGESFGSGPNMSSLVEPTKKEEVGDQPAFESTKKEEVGRPPEPPSFVGVDVGYDGNYVFDRASDQASGWDYRGENPVRFNNYGDMPTLEERVGKIADNFRQGNIYFGAQPTPDSPTAPVRPMGDAVNKVGAYVDNNVDENFLLIGSLVTENALVDAMYVDKKSDEVALREQFEPANKNVGLFDTPVQEGAMYTKSSIATKLGYEIAKEYKQYQTLGESSSTDITVDDATMLGDGFLELYARNNPDLIDAPQASKGKARQVGVYKVNERGVEVLNADMKKRQALFPSKLLRASKQPTKADIGAEISPGTKNLVGKTKAKDLNNPEILKEMIENLGSIGHVVNTRRARILLLTGLPALLGRSEGASAVGANINKVGSDKYQSLRSDIIGEFRRDGQDVNDPGIRDEINRLASIRLNNNKNNFANQVYGIASERRGANYLDFYVMSFNYRAAPLQTLFDPTNHKPVRFVTTSGTPVPIKLGSRYEKSLRQMYAMSLVKGADMKLPKERERLLRESHSELYAYGKLLRDKLDQDLPTDKYNAIMEAIENLEPVQSETISSVTGLSLDPNNPFELSLLDKIQGKGEDGNAYIDGLIDYANYYDALYNPKTKTGNFHSFFNAYMDGKTNGLAAAAMILGITRLGYKTGVLREGYTDLLDSGDIRDDVANKLKDSIESGALFKTGDPEVDNALRYVAGQLTNDDYKSSNRQLHKDATMTFGYGINPEAFALYIDTALNEIEASGKDPVFSKHMATLSSGLDVNGMGSSVANAINQVYVQSVVSSLSPEMLEARSLLTSVGAMFGLSDQLFTIKDPLGNPLSFGGYRMKDWDDTFTQQYSMFSPNEAGEVTRGARPTATRYDPEKLTSSVGTADKGPGSKAMSSGAVGAIQSTDAATIIMLLTGKSWDAIVKESNGNPYVHPVYDALKVDAASYDVVLREVNKNWAEVTMNYNHIAEASNAFKNLKSKVSSELSLLQKKGNKLSIKPGSDFEMVGFLLTPEVDMFGATVYPKLNKVLKASGILRHLQSKGYDVKNVKGIANRMVKDVGFDGTTEEVSPKDIIKFLDVFSKTIRLDERLSTLGTTVATNKKQMYSKIASQVDGRWITTADDILQYFAH